MTGMSMVGDTLQYFFNKSTLLLRNYDNVHRALMLERAMSFTIPNKVPGEYFEFGVFAGRTFQYAFHAAQNRGLRDMRFFAFDSFEGFSQPKGNDAIGIIEQGSRTCSESQFLSNIKRSGVDMSKVLTVKGWFSDTLEGDGRITTDQKLGEAPAAIVWMDADLYEPTLSALRYVEDRLQDGTVLIFDNWFLFKGHPQRGERRAVSEWLKTNARITLTPFYHFGWHGASFIVSLPV